jgi:type I restriction enzyme, S subunit
VSEHREDSDFISPDRLPHGWELLPLKDLMAGDKTAIKRGPFGSTIKKSFFASEGYKVYEQKNAIYDDATLGNYFVDPEKFDEMRDFEVKPGDFIVSCSGTIGRISRLPPNAQPGVINQALLKLTIDEGRVHPKYFLYLFRSHRLQQLVLKDTRGSAMKNLASVDDLKQIRLPLPPIKQQETIVAEIEKQFSRLDEAVVNLKRVKANLKRYKAAVLKAAVEGKLTEEWRKAHPNVEPAGELLKRILAERRARWNGKSKYKEPAAPDPTNLPNLPTGWCCVTLESISEALGGFAFESRKFSTSGYQVLKMANIRMGQIDVTQKPSYIEDVDQETVSKYELKEGDLVVTLTGTRKKRDYGYIAVVKTLKRLLLNQRIARLRPFSGVIPDYLLIAMQSDTYRNRFFASETGNVGQGNVGMTAITKEPVALAPMAEQEQIVAEVERQLSVMDETDAVIAANLQRGTRLQQSMLQKAFTGQLCTSSR